MASISSTPMDQEILVGSVLTETSYEYDLANRLTNGGEVEYTWDDNGNLLDDGVSVYTYDPANRLSSVVQGEESYTFSYNGLGDRLQQVANSQTTSYTLDLNAGLTQVLSDGTNTYTYGVGRIAQTDASSTEYFLGDALGSVRQLVDENPEIVLTEAYDPYGNVISSSGNGSSVYGFDAEQQDITRLIYLRAR
jgi:YD repeat-containing protein